MPPQPATSKPIPDIGLVNVADAVDTPALRHVVLRADGLCFQWQKPALFTDLSFQLASGVSWVQGGEGRGKTTLLRLLAADLAAQRGSLKFGGVSLAGDPQAYRAQVFWADPRTEALDALTPLAYWDALPQRYPAFDRKLLIDLVDGLGLEPHQHKALYMLSTGSKRKVWLAAAFASGATLTLLDEPFAALDKSSIQLVLDVLADAATHASRAWVVADYQAPAGVALAATIALGD